jgi:hypothetical protein
LDLDNNIGGNIMAVRQAQQAPPPPAQQQQAPPPPAQQQQAPPPPAQQQQAPPPPAQQQQAPPLPAQQQVQLQQQQADQQELAQQQAQCVNHLADLYSYGTLDCIVQLTKAIHEDMRTQPAQYRRVPGRVLRLITQFERVGKQEDWPDNERRAQMYAAELGPYEVAAPAGQTGSGPSREFVDHSNALREAAREFFKEPHVAAGERNVSPVRSAVKALRVFLKRRCGGGLAVNVGNIDSIFTAATNILKEPSIATVFNAQPIDALELPAWPLGGPTSTDITQFISAQLKSYFSADVSSLLQEKFTNLQQVAQFGSQTIRNVLNDNWDDWGTAADKTGPNFLKLIDDANEWGKALERCNPGRKA